VPQQPHPTNPAPGPQTDIAGRPDIANRADIERILWRFYGAAFEDPVIGAYFTEIAGTDLDTHIPRIADFWERALFRTADYRGDLLATHRDLHHARALTARHFGRWVQLWHATIDGLHTGPNADRAKAQGERVAQTMPRRLAGPDAGTDGAPGDGGFIPLATLTLRRQSP